MVIFSSLFFKFSAGIFSLFESGLSHTKPFLNMECSIEMYDRVTSLLDFFLTCKMTPSLPISQGDQEVKRVNINFVNDTIIEHNVSQRYI